MYIDVLTSDKLLVYVHVTLTTGISNVGLIFYTGFKFVLQVFSLVQYSCDGFLPSCGAYGSVVIGVVRPVTERSLI